MNTSIGVKEVKAFTILELLLTLLIILIIASNSVSNYYEAKKAAKAISCKSYRRQMDLIQSMPEFDYTNNYEEFSDYTSVVDEMVLMYNKCFECHPKVTNNNW